jgi:dihydroflavonol-4-reductase
VRPEAASSKLRGVTVLVTGATGFIGYWVARHLNEAGARVRALVLPGEDTRGLEREGVDVLYGDVRDRDAVSRAVQGCELVFHLAALYEFGHRRPDDLYEVNVGGTLAVLKACRQHSVRRLVYTSSVATIGVAEEGPQHPSTEERYPRIEHLFGAYKRSKYVAEHEVLRAGAQGMDVVLAHPTTPIGWGDYRPTPTGEIVLRFLRGQFFAYVDTWLNIVDVRDVAFGHLLCALKGRRGHSYILGGENLSLRSVLLILSEITGRPAPRLAMPTALLPVLATVSEVVQGGLLRGRPTVPREAAMMARTFMCFDDSKARKELGYSSRPVKEALASAVEFFTGAFGEPR